MDPSRSLGGGGRTSHLIPPGRQGRIGEAVTSFALKLFLGPLLTHVFSTSSRSSDRRQRCNRGQNSRNSALGRNRREMGPYDTLVELTPRNSSGPCRLRTSVHVQHGRGEDGSHVLWLTKRSSEDSHALPAGGVTTSQLVPYKELLSPGLCVTLLAVSLFEKAIQDFGVSVVNSHNVGKLQHLNWRTAGERDQGWVLSEPRCPDGNNLHPLGHDQAREIQADVHRDRK